MVNVMIVWMMCWTVSPSSDRHRKWVKYFLKKIRRLEAEKIVWPDDWADYEIWVLSVDGTLCWIAEPQHPKWQDRNYYSRIFNKAGISYELAIDIAKSRRFWMNGPFRAGTNDAKIFSKHGLLAKFVDIGKKGIGDKGYNGERYRHVISTSVFVMLSNLPSSISSQRNSDPYHWMYPL
jgi:hypothetical protein